MAVGRVKIIYWALVAVLAALTLFLLAAAARVLRRRRNGDAPAGV
jgi:hypothetical protein